MTQIKIKIGAGAIHNGFIPMEVAHADYRF